MSGDTPAPSFEQWRRTASTYRHRGHAIAYRAEGEGPALLAIHGFPSASWDWAPLWSRLTARFQVIAADMIGFGDSDKPRAYDYSILDQATLHEGLLATLGVERFHVLAHDYGDTVAQELLARHEARASSGKSGPAISSICFLNGGLFPEAHRPRFVQHLLASPLGFAVGALSSKATFRAGLTAVFGPHTPPSPQLVDELWTLLRHADGQRVLHRLIGYMAERRRHRERWVGPLLRTSVPLRLIDGSLDPVSGAHLAARYRELVPKADVTELPRVGHYPQVEDPDGVLRAFFAFHDRLAREP
jgi:pimeloyl-ACP methyl ester carboxylesterase